ncbi:hypothetical protein [Sciscionella sediminilitoris]|uniref:hypothetical protein n=1 Tax=Sciscionella sediminilitoris TaxID=1445613 RepID=UPI0018D0C278|nr:hypothetical protein [Sciscionella sp. SE31]
MPSFEHTALAADTTWVFTGDSITQGVYHTHGARSWVELCTNASGGNWIACGTS